MKETVINMQNKKVAEVDLSDEIFAQKPNVALIYEVVKMQQANKRRGTAKVLEHWEVSGTTAKMYRQKGTGRARHGDYRTNIFVGGGQAFGPKPRDYSYRLPQKARRGGVKAALALKKNEGKFLIVDELAPKEIKTKLMVDTFKKMGVTSGLIIVDEVNEKFTKSIRNIPNIKCLRCEGINVYDIMRYEHMVVTVPALKKIEEVLLS